MIKYKDFRFAINVSVDSYNNKQEASACLTLAGAKAVNREAMAFRENNVNAEEFLWLALSGHTFCHLFKYDPDKKYWFQDKKTGQYFQTYPEHHRGNNCGAMKICMKSDQFFYGSQVVFVDIDLTRFKDVPAYLSVLSKKPTCVYMSYTDNKDKKGVVSRRFRLVYVFDKILNRIEFQSVALSISRQIEIDTREKMDDDCGTLMSQYMNGVSDNNEKYCYYFIYSTDDFPPVTSPDSYSPPIQEAQEDNAPDDTTITFNSDLLRDMKSMPYEEFMHYYSTRYQYKYRTEQSVWTKKWLEGKMYTYQKVDGPYLQLWFYSDKVPDGEHRRRKLYKNACLRRLMFPEMDPDTALFNLYVDAYRFFDNSDGVITIEVLVRRIRNAYDTPMEDLVEYCKWEIQYWQTHHPEYIFPAGTQTSRGFLQQFKKALIYQQLDETYDRSKSLQENLASGIGVSQSTLYRYAENRAIDTNPNAPKSVRQQREESKQQKEQEIQLFKSIYDPNLSIAENKRRLEENGIYRSEPTIKTWARQYYEPPTKNDNTMAQEWNWNINLPPSPWFNFNSNTDKI